MPAVAGMIDNRALRDGDKTAGGSAFGRFFSPGRAMISNFSKALAFTLAYEGGWSDHPKDPGGATMKGITLAVYRQFKPGATKTDLRKISDGDVAEIYSTNYWRKVNGDRLASGVDLATFDAAVNSGVSRANKWLMAAIGGADDQTVRRICAARLGFVRSLKIWSTFGKGWSRRIAAVEAKGVAWALAAKSPRSAVKAALLGEVDAAKKVSARQTKGATTAGGASAAGGGAYGLDAGQADTAANLLVAGLLIAGLALVAVLVVRGLVNKHRAEAYVAEVEALEASV